MVDYFKVIWEEDRLINKDKYQDALKKLEYIAGRCFNNIIYFLTWKCRKTIISESHII